MIFTAFVSESPSGSRRAVAMTTLPRRTRVRRLDAASAVPPRVLASAAAVFPLL